MKWYYFGIVLPLVLFFAVMLLGLLNIGITQEEMYAKEIKASDLFLPVTGEGNQRQCNFVGSEGKAILLKTVTVKNSFFIPRQIEIPSHFVCFAPLSSGNAYGDIRYLVDGYAPDSNDFNQRTFVLPSHSEKKIEVKLIPVCPLGYGYEAPMKGAPRAVPAAPGEQKVLQFNEIWIIPAEHEDYVDCNLLTAAQAKRVIHIPIV